MIITLLARASVSGARGESIPFVFCPLRLRIRGKLSFYLQKLSGVANEICFRIQSESVTRTKSLFFQPHAGAHHQETSPEYVH